MENTTLYFLLCFTYLMFRLMSRIWMIIYDAHLGKKWTSLDIFQDDLVYPIATVKQPYGGRLSKPLYSVYKRQNVLDAHVVYLLKRLNVFDKIIGITNSCSGYIRHLICCECPAYNRVFYICNCEW